MTTNDEPAESAAPDLAPLLHLLQSGDPAADAQALALAASTRTVDALLEGCAAWSGTFRGFGGVWIDTRVPARLLPPCRACSGTGTDASLALLDAIGIAQTGDITVTLRR